jgi:hypothetical protein
MEAMIHVGNSAKQVKDTAKQASEAIDLIFSSARENTMDQATVVEALHSLAQIAEVKNVQISNNTFTSSNGKEPAPLSSEPPKDTEDTIVDETEEDEDY